MLDRHRALGEPRPHDHEQEAGVLARFAAALFLVAITYNPEGSSYYHWVVPHLPEFDAVKAFAGVVLLIGWTVYLRAATRSLGAIGFALAAAFFGTLVWMGIDSGVIAKDSPRVMTWVSIVALSGILTAGMVWSLVRRRLAGQVDVLVGVPPHRPPAVVKESGLTGDGAWIAVDPATLRTSHESVFAIGDVTQIELANGLPLPKAGLFAELEGHHVAAAIAARSAQIVRP